MTQQQMIESIQQIYPDMRETQLRLLLNDALDEFVEETRVLTDTKTLTFTEKVSNGTFSGNIDGWSDYWGNLSSDPDGAYLGSNFRIAYDTAGSPNYSYGQGLKNSAGIKLYKNVEYTVVVKAKPLTANTFNALTSLVSSSDIAGGTTLLGVANAGVGAITMPNVEIYTLTYTITPKETANHFVYAFFNNASVTMSVDFTEISIKPNSSNRYYYLFENFDDEILSINKVDLDNVALNRYIGPIEDTDVT